MGDGDPTELAAVETDTESVRAWGLTDFEDEPPTRRLITPGRITGVAVATSLVAVTVAGVLAWHLRNQDEPIPAAAMSSMVPATTMAVPVAAPAPPPPPPVPMMNGVYSVFHDWANTTSRNTITDTGGNVKWDADGLADTTLWSFSSRCTTRTDCITTGTALDDRRRPIESDNPFVLKLNNGVWENIAPPHWLVACTYQDTGKVAARAWHTQIISYVARPDGTFTGTMTTTVDSNECGDMGDTAITPLVATLVDAP